ncbi:MAG: Crp/Fnr family transcriptional regulator [Gammaproteobacteria bacterium]|nr:Crp/Fnr family transcriptional regulator [Gammaproteobacteria bacterium]
MQMKLSLKEAWQGESNCRNCTVRTTVLFAGLHESDFERIHTPIDDLVFEPDALLYRAGEQGAHIFTLRQGLLKMVQYLPDGTRRIVRLAGNSDVIGLESLLGEPYQHDAVILQRSELCRIPVSVVQNLCSGNPDLHQELMRRWQRALSEAEAWLTELSTGTARQRMAHLLLRLVVTETEPVCQLFSRDDIGAMLGITMETASRVIAEFKRNNWLQELKPTYYRCDVTALKVVISA